SGRDGGSQQRPREGVRGGGEAAPDEARRAQEQAPAQTPRRGAGAEEAHPASRARLHPGQAARRGGRGPLLLDRREEPFGRPLREGEAAPLAAGREPVPFAGPRGGARGNRRERVALAGREGRGKEEAGAGPR